MTPAARLQATIELYDLVAGAVSRPADAVVNDYVRARRFIGGGDRRDISERLYRMIRRRAQLRWWLERVGAYAYDGRALALAETALGEGRKAKAIDGLCEGGAYAPQPLNAKERAWLDKLSGQSLDHPEQAATVTANIPDWIEPLLEAALGHAWPAEMAAMLKPAPVDVRANVLKVDRQRAAEALKAENIGSDATPFSPQGLRLRGRPPLVASAAFREGLVEIQDEGSQLASLLVDARAGMRVVDFCAGAGGKTLALAGAMANKGQLIACDINGPRLERAVKRLRRAGAHNVERRELDATTRKWIKRAAASADRVLIDAPCTGTGTWRRNPDGRWSLAPADLDELVAKQAAILDQAAPLVKQGGRLIYVTCSLLAAENAGQVDGFLARNPRFFALPIGEVWKQVLESQPPEGALRGNYLQLTPLRHGTDGFFVAVLERRIEPKPDPKPKRGKEAGAEAELELVS